MVVRDGMMVGLRNITILCTMKPQQEQAETLVYRHCLPIQIRFNDVDQYGHVNNNAYFLDQYYIDFFIKFFVSYIPNFIIFLYY